MTSLSSSTSYSPSSFFVRPQVIVPSDATENGTFETFAYPVGAAVSIMTYDFPASSFGPKSWFSPFFDVHESTGVSPALTVPSAFTCVDSYSSMTASSTSSSLVRSNLFIFMERRSSFTSYSPASFFESPQITVPSFATENGTFVIFAYPVGQAVSIRTYDFPASSFDPKSRFSFFFDVQESIGVAPDFGFPSAPTSSASYSSSFAPATSSPLVRSNLFIFMTRVPSTISIESTDPSSATENGTFSEYASPVGAFVSIRTYDSPA